MDLVERDGDRGSLATRCPFLAALDPEQDVVERLDVRERVVARDVPVVAPPHVDVAPGHAVHQERGDERAVDPDRR